MALFNIPHRNDIDIKEIIEKSKEEYRPKVSIKGKGNTLTTKLAAIAETVKKNLGKEADNYLCITDDSDFIAYCQQAVNRHWRICPESRNQHGFSCQKQFLEKKKAFSLGSLSFLKYLCT